MQHEGDQCFGAGNDLERSAVEDGVQSILLPSWRSFFDLVVDELSQRTGYMFRGQTDFEWPIISSLDRWEQRYVERRRASGDPGVRAPWSAERHLKAFQRAVRGRGIRPLPEIDDTDEWWAMGQHYGLKTPLLDWTASPFVALFFAFGDEYRQEDGQAVPPENRGVYALSVSVTQAGDQGQAEPVRVVVPESHANYRLASQSGVLLWMPRGQDLESYIRQRFCGETQRPVLIKIGIPNLDRDACLVTLHKMNINYMTLFPDIDGAARHVNSLWDPGHEDLSPYL